MAKCPICSKPAAPVWLFVRGAPIYRCSNCRCGFRELKSREIESSTSTQHAAFGPEYVRARASIQSVLTLEARRSLRILSRLAPPPGRLLEIGCATGELLRLASAAGYETVGLELSEAAARYACEQYGLDVRTMPLEDLSARCAPFDVVVAIHTLEHFPNSQRAVEHIARTLRPGGVLFVEVPSVESWAVRLRGRKSGVFTDEHYVLHSQKSLRMLLEDRGLSVAQVISVEGYMGLFNAVADWVGVASLGRAIVKRLRGGPPFPADGVRDGHDGAARVGGTPGGAQRERSIDRGRKALTRISASVGVLLSPVRGILGYVGLGGAIIALAEAGGTESVSMKVVAEEARPATVEGGVR